MDIKFLDNHSNGEHKINGNTKSKNESKKSKYGHVITDEYKMTEKSDIEEAIRSKKQSLEKDKDLKRKRSNDRKQSVEIKVKKSKKSKTQTTEEDDEESKEFESKHKLSKEKKKKSKLEKEETTNDDL